MSLTSINVQLHAAAHDFREERKQGETTVIHLFDDNYVVYQSNRCQNMSV